MSNTIRTQQFNTLDAQESNLKSIPDRINKIIAYYEFFKSALTNRELLTGIQDQMDLHSINLNLVNGCNSYYMGNLAINNTNKDNGPITQACRTLWIILNELEQLCKHDLINKQPNKLQ